MKPEDLLDYQDDQRLERVFSRLKRTPLRSRRDHSFRSMPGMLRAAALIALGVASGMSYERLTSQAQPLVMVRNDQSGVSASALSIHNNQAASPTDDESRQLTTPGKETSRSAKEGSQPSSGQGKRRLRASRLGSKQPIIASPEITLDDESPQLPAFGDYQMEDIPAWRRHSEQGQFAEALSELEASGGFDAAFVDAASEELMLLADIARFAGRRGRAIQALRLITTTYYLSPQAPMAALTLGHLLSAAGDPESAADAYALNRRLSPAGDFAEDALVREFSLAVETSHLKQAQHLFTQYQRDFPEGRQQESLAEELERLLEVVRARERAEDESSESLSPEAQELIGEVTNKQATDLVAPGGKVVDVNAAAGDAAAGDADESAAGDADESPADEGVAGAADEGDADEAAAAAAGEGAADEVVDKK